MRERWEGGRGQRGGGRKKEFVTNEERKAGRRREEGDSRGYYQGAMCHSGLRDLWTDLSHVAGLSCQIQVTSRTSVCVCVCVCVCGRVMKLEEMEGCFTIL